MATITYQTQVLKKPIEERIIDAACIYWNVEREYFFQKRSDTNVVHRKGIIYYLLKQNTTYSYEFMANKFGFSSHQAVSRLVENIDATKNIYKQTFNDIEQIRQLADKLNAECFNVEVKVIMKLINNKLELTV
jgi:chromosomal replication initiation ATPase DnaA